MAFVAPLVWAGAAEAQNAPGAASAAPKASAQNAPGAVPPAAGSASSAASSSRLLWLIKPLLEWVKPRLRVLVVVWIKSETRSSKN